MENVLSRIDSPFTLQKMIKHQNKIAFLLIARIQFLKIHALWEDTLHYCLPYKIAFWPYFTKNNHIPNFKKHFVLLNWPMGNMSRIFLFTKFWIIWSVFVEKKILLFLLIFSFEPMKKSPKNSTYYYSAS